MPIGGQQSVRSVSQWFHPLSQHTECTAYMKSATLGHMRVILVLALLLISVGSAARQLAAPKVLAGEALEEAQQFYERTSGKDVPAELGMAHSSMARVIDGLKHAVADPALDTDSPTAAQMAVLSQIYQGLQRGLLRAPRAGAG